MTGIIKRNLLVFFRDRSSVFFSMLAPFIVIGVYVLFLGNAYSDGFGGMDVTFMMDRWIMAGLLGVTIISTTMGAFAIMVADRSKNTLKDFYSSPVSRSKLTGGYVISSFIIGFIMTLITFALAEIFIVARGGEVLGLTAFLKTLGILVLTNLCNTAIIFFVVTLLSSENAFATASSIVGTMVGFLTGIYVPIGSLPDAVQWVIKIFPPSHSVSLLRQVMMEKPLAETLAADTEGKLEGIKEELGIVLKVGSHDIPPIVSVLLLVVCGAVFYILSIYSLSRKKK
ncbi:MAG: ABC transporter permease [Eubacteriales bacterium]